MSSKPLPFHKALIGAINHASDDDIVCLASLIPNTIIPADHDLIKAAWEKRLKVLAWQGIDYGVPAHLDEEKRRCEKEAGSEKYV